MFAAPRSEAGGFSLSIFFPVHHAPPPCPPPAPPPCEVWVPGHYETHSEQVWVQGDREKVWVPPAYKTVWDGCRYIRVICAPGHYDVISHPGHYECSEVQVWVRGHYELARNDAPPVYDSPREHDRDHDRGEDRRGSYY